MSLAANVCLLLSEWISFLLVAVPPRSRRTFVELLIGCLLNPEGWVTRAIGAIRREAHWTTYYKLIERAQVPVTELSLRLLQLVLRVCPTELVTLILDDTLVPRCAKFGPGISIKHDHSHKANRPTFLNSQCWVTLALVVRVRLGSALTVPIRSWLLEESGQRGKLWVARQLMDSIRGHVKGVRLLIDAWFMRRSLILPLLEQQVRIIGQVRRDTALFLPPQPEPKRRGRKRKYGQRVDAAMLETLPIQEMELMLYGKVQPVRVRSVFAVARFLKGLPVRAVWCEMFLPDHTWSRPRLILATETDLSAQQIVEIYAERWGIEPLFHNLKRWWGVANLWQQSKAALELWMQIRATAYALTQLLALQLWQSFPLMAIAPWRKGAMITAGLFAQWLRMQFIGLPVRGAYDPKSGQFVMPFPGQDQRLQC
ncbi:MAG: transposase [Candidatus Accumulibacter sp.]|nr:transposase [Accumulibacter sp.]